MEREELIAAILKLLNSCLPLAPGAVCVCKHAAYLYICVFVSINKKQLHLAVCC